MTAQLPVVTPAEFVVERSRLEFLLINSWLMFPSLRKTWLPDPSEFGTDEIAALAGACRWIAAERPTQERELYMLLPEAMFALGTLKRFPEAIGHMPVACHNQPAKGLERWRKLRCLIVARRSLVETLLKLTPDTDPSDLNAAILEASSLTSVSGETKPLTKGELFAIGAEDMTRRDQSRGFCGFPDLDRAIGALKRGHVWVLGAPTNWGKTSWLIAVAAHHHDLGGKALLVSCEDAPALIGTRWLVREAGINGMNARNATLTNRELESMAQALSDAKSKAPVFLDGRGMNVEEMGESIKRLVSLHGVDLVMVDYLQCVRTQRQADDRRGEINHIADTLRMAIKTSGCAGILTSQLTGDDIRESRDVEHNAEVVLIGKKDDDGAMSIFVKKGKAGGTGAVIPLTWDRDTGSFVTEKEIDYGFQDM